MMMQFGLACTTLTNNGVRNVLKGVKNVLYNLKGEDYHVQGNEE